MRLPRFSALYRHRQWIVLDRETGIEIPATDEWTAKERAALCEGVRRLIHTMIHKDPNDESGTVRLG